LTKFPVAPPGLGDARKIEIPLCFEFRQSCFSLCDGSRYIDSAQISGNRSAQLPGHVVQAVSDQMDDAELDRRLGINGFDRFEKAFQPIDTGDEDVLDAAPIYNFSWLLAMRMMIRFTSYDTKY
jgi:hypothetical protein